MYFNLVNLIIMFFRTLLGLSARIYLSESTIKKKSNHSRGSSVPMFHVFYGYWIDCCLSISIRGNPKAIYGQDLAFRLSVKCKAPLQKRKNNKTQPAGFHFVFSDLFLAAFIATVAKLLRTLCALGVCLTSGRNSFCGSSFMLEC